MKTAQGVMAAFAAASGILLGWELSSTLKTRPYRPDAYSMSTHPGARLADGTICAGLSPDTGRPMETPPSDAPGTYAFDEAKAYCAGLDVNGHDDWRVPTKDELKVLFNNRVAIGGFNESGSEFGGWYWSSTESSSSYEASDQRFSDGYQGTASKGGHSSLRCVRG
jgi:Protein of unknown function (DUF1566)